jgi:hypothetical protein
VREGKGQDVVPFSCSLLGARIHPRRLVRGGLGLRFGRCLRSFLRYPCSCAQDNQLGFLHDSGLFGSTYKGLEGVERV